MDLGASLQSKDSSHGIDRDLIRMQDKEQDALTIAKLEESPGSVVEGVNEAQDVLLSNGHHEEDVVEGKMQLEETFLGKSSEEDLILNERVKAAASRASNDGTIKQMGPAAKICLRNSGSKQVSLVMLYFNKPTVVPIFISIQTGT